MKIESQTEESRYLVSLAKVLGCLRNGQITVILCPGIGFVDGGILTEIPIDLIPSDLRMPNQEFDVEVDRVTGYCTQVLRKGSADCA
jgi:hypothetical protein